MHHICHTKFKICQTYIWSFHVPAKHLWVGYILSFCMTYVTHTYWLTYLEYVDSTYVCIYFEYAVTYVALAYVCRKFYLLWSYKCKVFCNHMRSSPILSQILNTRTYMWWSHNYENILNMLKNSEYICDELILAPVCCVMSVPGVNHKWDLPNLCIQLFPTAGNIN